MRPLLSLILCSAVAAPGAALAQNIAAAPKAAAPAAESLALTPLPTVAPTEPAPAPATAAPPPTVEAAAPAPVLAAPETITPVIVAKEDKGGGAASKVGQIAVGVGAGAAGAAVAGPVGKFAAGFIGKRLAHGLFGKKDETPELTVIPQTTAPTGAAVSAAAMAARARAPPPAADTKKTLVADER
jgi:hypothetical protein